MTDTVDALARAINNAYLNESGLEWVSDDGTISLLNLAADLTLAFEAEGLSIVKTAEWERAQRVEHAAADVDGAWGAEDRDGAPILWYAEAGEVLADLREALETP